MSFTSIASSIQADEVTYVTGHASNFIDHDWSEESEEFGSSVDNTLIVSPFTWSDKYAKIAPGVIISNNHINGSKTYVCDYSTALGILATEVSEPFEHIVVFYSRNRMMDIHILYTWMKESNVKAKRELRRGKRMTMIVPTLYISRLFEDTYDPRTFESNLCSMQSSFHKNPRLHFFEPNSSWNIQETIETLMRPYIVKDRSLNVTVIVPIGLRIDRDLISLWRSESIFIDQVHPLKYGTGLQTELDSELDVEPQVNSNHLIIDLSYETKEDVESRTRSANTDYIVGCSREWYCKNVPVSPMIYRWNPTCIGSSLANYNGYNLTSDRYVGRTVIKDVLLLEIIDLVRKGFDPETSLLICYLNESKKITSTTLFYIAMIETVRRMRPENVYPMDDESIATHDDETHEIRYDRDRLVNLLYERVEHNEGITQIDDITSLVYLLDNVRSVILEAFHRYYQKLCTIFNFVPIPLTALVSSNGVDAKRLRKLRIVIDAYVDWSECLNFKSVKASGNRLNTLTDTFSESTDEPLVNISKGLGRWWCVLK